MTPSSLKPGRITERMRLEMGLEMIEEQTDACCTMSPRKNWRQAHAALCKIYEIVHSINSPKCRKNHPEWCAQIDDAINSKEKQ